MRKIQSLYTQNSFSGAYSWVALSQTESTVSRLCVFPPERIKLTAPGFSGFGYMEAALRTPFREIAFPAVDICFFKDAMIVGGVDFTFVDQQVIHHDLFQPVNHNCPAENLGIIQQSLNDKKHADLWLRSTPVTVALGASMIGQCSANYAHWLTEILPKLAILNLNSGLDDVPLLIDDQLHPNILESIEFISVKKRSVIVVDRWTPLRVENLVTVSSPGYERYVPHGVVSKEPPAYINKFSRSALMLLREVVLSKLHISDNKLEYPRKVYLERSKKSKNLRQIVNIEEIEIFLASQNVYCVQPKELTFKEQVEACIFAELIVSPIGAALTNMIFAPPGCKIICMSPYYKDANYFYYANLASTLGHEIHFVLGQQASSNNHPMHRDYSIDVNLIRAHFSLE